MVKLQLVNTKEAYELKESRKVCLDNELKIEAYQFQGIMQKFPNHFHDHYVIGFIGKGRRHLSCKNKEYVTEAGDMLLFNPRDNHSCEQMDNETLDYRCLNIKEEVMQGIVEEITGLRSLPEFLDPVIFHCEYVPQLQELHKMIMEENKDFAKEEILIFLMEQLINRYAETEISEFVSDEESVEKVCLYVELHYSEAIKLEELCFVAGINKYALLRVFTKTKGMTPYQYLQTIRINKAKKLLEQGVEPLYAAMQTGFTDQSHFSNFFKKFIGLTPGQYRNIFKVHMS